MPFKEHVTQLCLPIPLYLASIKFQAENSYGKAYGNLIIYLEGCLSLGLISEADYELYHAKYDRPLTDNIKKTPEQYRKEQTREAYRKEMNRYFGNVLKDYSYLKKKKPENLKAFIEKAMLPENNTIKNAKLLLELAEQEAERVVVES